MNMLGFLFSFTTDGAFSFESFVLSLRTDKPPSLRQLDLLIQYLSKD